MRKHSKFSIQQSLIRFTSLEPKSLNFISLTKKMLRLSPGFIFLLCCILQVNAQNFINRPSSPNDTLISYQVNDNGSATFRLYAPDAKSVQLAGDVKAVKTEKTDNGIWVMTTAPNIPWSVYRYCFIVDGMQVNDPKNPMVADFRPMVELVPKGESLFWQKKDVPHGLMSIVYYESKATNSTRRMFVWTPPQYFSNNKKLPVLYLMHGGGDNDTNWPGQGKAGWILDNLFAEGKITPMIVVMPDGSIPVETFAHDLGSNIIPFIEANFRVLADASHRAIAGLSMGGMQLLETLVDYPDMFAYINVMSSGWSSRIPGAFEKKEERLKAVAPILKKNIKYFIFTTGGKDDGAAGLAPTTRALFTKYGIKSEFSEMDGGHSMYVWRHDLYNFTQKIFK